MKFSLIHATMRFDPEGQHYWYATMKEWLAKAARPQDIEYILIVHHSHLAAYQEHVQEGWDKAWGAGRLIVNMDRNCLVDQMNAGLLASSGEIIFDIADDLFPPQDWDARLQEFCPDTSQRIALKVRTGSASDDDVFVTQCVTRSLLEAIGPVSPEYDSMYLDNEFTAQIKRYGKVVDTGLLFDHRHPVLGTAQSDATYEKQNRPEAYRIGREVFERRRAQGFPRVELPGWPKAEIEAKTKLTLLQKAANGLDRLLNPAPVPLPRRTVAVCLPNKNYDWLASIFNVQGALGKAGFDFAAMLGYSSTADATRIGLARSVLDSFAQNPSTPYVLWIDDDNIVPPELIKRWVSEFDANPQMDILCGWCWIQRGVTWAPSVGVFKDPEPICTWFTLQDIFQGGPEIRRVDNLASGFPCVMMRREVLEVLGPTAFRRIPCDKNDTGLVGEDFSFMWRAKEKGFRCYLDPMGKVGHLKLICQEPDILPAEALADPVLKQMREQVNGRPVLAPKEYRNVGA